MVEHGSEPLPETTLLVNPAWRQLDMALTVCLHPLPRRLQDETVLHLAEELTATETVFPGTDLRLVFKLDGPS